MRRYDPRFGDGENVKTTRRVAGMEQVLTTRIGAIAITIISVVLRVDRLGHLRRRTGSNPPSAGGRKNSAYAVLQKRHLRCKSCAVQVVLIGESQGGHVVSKLATVTGCDALVLLSSLLPDRPEVVDLTHLGTVVVVGWKVCKRTHGNGRMCITLLICQKHESYWDGRAGAERVVAALGPRAFLTRSFPGGHSSWKAREVRCTCSLPCLFGS